MMHDFFRYKMTETRVQEIKLPNPTLKSFIRETESKHGEILSLSMHMIRSWEMK
jgi:hypothetical protein